MDTLRSFVQAVWTTDANVRSAFAPEKVWSKPDHVSNNYELRRLTTAEGKNGKRTDFYELYWADQMEGTQVKHITAWLRLLLWRSPRHIPRQLQGLWWTIVILTVFTPLSLALWKLGYLPIPGWLSASLGTLGAVFWLVASGFLVNVAGDAARYLHVSPPNIARRRRVRDAGLRLLRRLHQSGDYDRIILVGHSLGSVIGYDILTYLWPRYNTGHAETAKNESPEPDPLEKLAARPGLTPDEYQSAQLAYARQLRQAGNRWLVSDFITLGSPLAHATFLMARTPGEFVRKRVERELPACPPELEEVKQHQRFCFPRNGVWVPNHAAVFAPTRWTNLFFPCRWTIKGDVIGGPMREPFGPGVKDVAVATDINGGCLTHTAYWSFPAGWSEESPVPEHIAALRQALDLGAPVPPVDSSSASAS